MPLDCTRDTLIAFMDDLTRRGPFERHLAADVTFTDVDTGRIVRGRAAVARLIRLFHGDAFDTRAIIKSSLVHDHQMVIDMDLVGTHTGEFKGLAPTGRRIDVPCSVAFEICNERIIALSGQLPIDQLLRQIGAAPPATLGVGEDYAV